MEEQENEIKVIGVQLKTASSQSLQVTRDNANLKAEIEELKKDATRITGEKDVYKGKLKESEQSLKALQDKHDKLTQESTDLSQELSLLKKKLLDSEYAAYCYSLKEPSVIAGHSQEVQVVLRKNCHGEGILEFENKNGDLRVVKASLVTDVESDPQDPKRFVIKYKQFGCFGLKTTEAYESDQRPRLIYSLKSFLTKCQAEHTKESRHPSVNFQRNIMNDLKNLFFA